MSSFRGDLTDVLAKTNNCMGGDTWWTGLVWLILVPRGLFTMKKQTYFFFVILKIEVNLLHNLVSRRSYRVRWPITPLNQRFVRIASSLPTLEYLTVEKDNTEYQKALLDNFQYNMALWWFVSMYYAFVRTGKRLNLGTSNWELFRSAINCKNIKWNANIL